MRRSYSKYRERNGADAKDRAVLRVLSVRSGPGRPAEGLMRAGPLMIRCALGKGGVTARKREGDGATPLARMRLASAWLRPGRIQRRSGLPFAMIGEGLGWCDAVGDRNYNRPVQLPYPASHERMWRNDHLYDAMIVLDWNLRPRRRGAGSAIFFHLARPGYEPTEGCVAVSERDMRRLLPLLSPRTVMIVTR